MGSVPTARTQVNKDTFLQIFTCQGGFYHDSTHNVSLNQYHCRPLCKMLTCTGAPCGGQKQQTWKGWLIVTLPSDLNIVTVGSSVGLGSHCQTQKPWDMLCSGSDDGELHHLICCASKSSTDLSSQEWWKLHSQNWDTESSILNADLCVTFFKNVNITQT